MLCLKTAEDLYRIDYKNRIKDRIMWMNELIMVRLLLNIHLSKMLKIND